MAQVLHIDPDHLKMRPIQRAVEVLNDGGVIVYPTDTVYGLGPTGYGKQSHHR